MTELVERARDGDVDAFVALVEERQARMARVATAILGHPADADDALQTWLEAVWRSLPSLREPERFDAWSDRILVNACRQALRRRTRDRSAVVWLGPDGLVDAPLDVDASTAVAEREALEHAFETLSVEDRAAIVLHHLEGRPLDAIAARLDIPVGTLKARLFRARQAIRRSLEASGR